MTGPFGTISPHMKGVAERHKRDGSMEDARRLLRVEAGASADEIRRAFRNLVQAAHPDSGGYVGDIDQIKKARDLLLSQCLPNENIATMQSCRMCGGRGSVAMGFENIDCTACGGTGEVKC